MREIQDNQENYKRIQIMPLKDGKQAVYSCITLAGHNVPDPPDSQRSYELPPGVYALVPIKLRAKKTAP